MHVGVKLLTPPCKNVMKKKLLVVGAGPKGLALAAKADALSHNGYDVPELILIEKDEVAAHWSGKFGFTDGNQVLGTAAEKDLGFPYASKKFKRDIDLYVFSKYSWLAFNLQKRSSHPDALDRYAEDIDRGLKGQPLHGQWAEYLGWVAGQITSGIQIVTGQVEEISSLGDRWRLSLKNGSNRSVIEGDGLVITGPGMARTLPGQPNSHPRVFDGRTFWQQIDSFSDAASNDEPIGIIGSGETAASIVIALARTLRQAVPIYVVNRQGAIFTRGEGYWENHLYTDPDEQGDWSNLPFHEREQIIQRTDRGVFSVGAMNFINQLRNVFHKRMNVAELEIVTKYELEKEGRPVIVDESGLRLPVQYAIVATGFDPWWFVNLFKEETLRALMIKDKRAELMRQIEPDLSFKREWMPTAKLHVPMLSSLAQGPGFPNLSCLGHLSDRILSSYAKEREA